MINMSRKTLGFLALGGAVAGAAAMLFTKRGRELGSKLKADGGELFSGAINNFAAIKDKAMNLIEGDNNNDASGKTKTGVVNERNETNTVIKRGDSASASSGAENVISRGDSALQGNQHDADTGANIRRGDSAEEMIH